MMVHKLLVVAVNVVCHDVRAHTHDFEHSGGGAAKDYDSEDNDDENGGFECRRGVRVVKTGCEGDTDGASETRPEEHYLVGLGDFVFVGEDSCTAVLVAGEEVDDV